MSSATRPESGRPPLRSFRDPGGYLVQHEGRLLRVVLPAGQPNLRSLLSSPAGQRMSSSGSIVASHPLPREESAALLSVLGVAPDATLLEHERLPFPSYAYEWPAEMLAAAAELTLDLAEALLPEGLGLKDATPFNVLFRGPQPVFVDVLSVEPRDPGDPVWRPYAQFVRTFLLPLLAYKHFGLRPAQAFTAGREGLSPEEVYEMAGPLRRLLPPFLGYASMPTWLAPRSERSTAIYQPRRMGDPEKVRFIIGALLRRLRRTLRSACDFRKTSAWTGYVAERPSYTAAQLEAKRGFVEEFLEEFRPAQVLDVGCNTGDFSLLAARHGAGVVAVDGDAAVAGEVFRRARQERAQVLPLVVNLAQPSPATGWRNAECASFLDRARGGFDAVLMLAVLHHMLVSERVPLDDALDLGADLTRGLALVEFVDPEDPMFRRIARGRDELHQDLNAAAFEASARRRFDVVRSLHLQGSARTLYVLRRK